MNDHPVPKPETSQPNQVPDARKEWCAPRLREFDASMTKTNAGLGPDGGVENTSAS